MSPEGISYPLYILGSLDSRLKESSAAWFKLPKPSYLDPQQRLQELLKRKDIPLLAKDTVTINKMLDNNQHSELINLLSQDLANIPVTTSNDTSIYIKYWTHWARGYVLQHLVTEGPYWDLPADHPATRITFALAANEYMQAELAVGCITTSIAKEVVTCIAQIGHKQFSTLTVEKTYLDTGFEDLYATEVYELLSNNLI